MTLRARRALSNLGRLGVNVVADVQKQQNAADVLYPAVGKAKRKTLIYLSLPHLPMVASSEELGGDGDSALALFGRDLRKVAVHMKS